MSSATAEFHDADRAHLLITEDDEHRDITTR